MMRVFLKISPPIGTRDAVVTAVALPKKLQFILAGLKTEGAYFFANERAQGVVYIILELQDPARITEVVKLFFLAFDANVELYPPMAAEAGIAVAVRKNLS